MKELGKQTGRLITILLSAAMVLTSIPTEVFAFSTDVDEVIMEDVVAEDVIAEDIVTTYDTVSEEDTDIVENGDEDAVVSAETTDNDVVIEESKNPKAEKLGNASAEHTNAAVCVTWPERTSEQWAETDWDRFDTDSYNVVSDQNDGKIYIKYPEQLNGIKSFNACIPIKSKVPDGYTLTIAEDPTFGSGDFYSSVGISYDSNKNDYNLHIVCFCNGNKDFTQGEIRTINVKLTIVQCAKVIIKADNPDAIRQIDRGSGNIILNLNETNEYAPNEGFGFFVLPAKGYDIGKVTYKKNNGQAGTLVRQTVAFNDPNDEHADKYYSLPRCNPGDSFEVSIATKVKQVIGSVKVNNKAGGVFTQAYGSDASYKLTLNNGADFGELTVKAFIGNSTTADSHNLASISDGRLTVRTYYENGTYSHYGDRTFPNYYLIKDPITLRFYRPGQTPDSEEEISGCTCTINPASPSLPKPTKITASNITDVSMDIRVAIVKNLPYKNMMVCIDREPVGAVPENMDSGKITFFAVYDDFKSSGSIYTGTWSVVGAKNAEGKWKPEFPPTPGTGSTQKFIYTATMVQYSDLSDIKDENILAKSQTLTATASTKALQYENALSLTAKTGAFTAGGPNVTLAEVKYSKATYSGYKKLDPEKTYLVDAEGNKIYLSTASQPTVLDLSENNNNLIILTNTAYIAPGTATLYVEPLLPSNTLNTAKTLKFTVKKPISNITILPYNTQLRKALNKDTSLKFTAKCTYTDGSPSASSNVKWVVGTGSGDSFAEFASSDRHYDKVTINAKTGQLKVAKDYIPTADDKFCLRVTANDYVGNTVFAERELAIVTDEITVTDVSVPGVDTDHAKPIVYSDTDTSSQENYLVGRSFVIKGRRGSGEEKIIPNSEFTFKSSSSGLTVDDTGMITKVTRAGIYTVSIIPNQGGTKFDKKITVEDVKPSYVFTVLTDDPTDRSSNIMPRRSFSEDAFESGIPEINVDNLNVCYVMASLMRGSERSTLTYSPKWSCKSASTVKTMYRPWDGVELYGVFKLKPGENTLTFSGGYKGYSDKTIKIINNVEGTDKLKRVDSTKIVENSGVTAETGYRNDSYDSRKYSLEFEVSGNVRLGTDCGIYLGFEIGEKTMNDNARKNHYAQMARYLRDSRDDAGNVINTTYPANNRIRFTHDFDGLPKGDYQFYATLYDRDGKPLTKPVEVMIKVRALNAAKSAIKSSVNMTKAADGYRYGELSMKSSSNIIDYKVVAILNNNKGGEVNKFTKFFRLDNSGTTPRLTCEDITGVSTDDMTGWVRYKTLGEDGHTEVERTEKITVVLR